LQEDALHKAGCEKIFRDVASGAVDSRRGLGIRRQQACSNVPVAPETTSIGLDLTI
jgi:hypothetical protein